MSVQTPVSPEAAASEVSLNTRIVQTITQVNFGRRLNQIHNYYFKDECFTWIRIENATDAFVNIEVEIPMGGQIITQTIAVRLGVFYPIRGLSVSSSDVNVVANVGVRQ